MPWICLPLFVFTFGVPISYLRWYIALLAKVIVALWFGEFCFGFFVVFFLLLCFVKYALKILMCVLLDSVILLVPNILCVFVIISFLFFFSFCIVIFIFCACCWIFPLILTAKWAILDKLTTSSWMRWANVGWPDLVAQLHERLDRLGRGQFFVFLYSTACLILYLFLSGFSLAWGHDFWVRGEVDLICY